MHLGRNTGSFKAQALLITVRPLIWAVNITSSITYLHAHIYSAGILYGGRDAWISHSSNASSPSAKCR